MDDPSGVQAALAIEAVEWEPVTGQNLIIRVRGRWRRRRPALRGQPLLVIEAGGQRHRFPATPEPPSLAGAPPGSWQMTFSVPSWLAPHLAGRSWLQLGLAVVPLPPPSGPVPPPSEPVPPPSEPAQPPRDTQHWPGEHAQTPGEAPQPDPEVLADRRVRTAEIAAQRERDRRVEAETLVADLTARIDALEEELAAVRLDAEQLRQLAADHERARRRAEQREHAEQALRLELEEELDRRAADVRSERSALGDLAASEERIRQLEVERDRLLARVGDAERIAAVAAPPPATGPHLEAELWLAHGLAPSLADSAPAPSPPGPAELRALAGERALVRGRAGTAVDQPGSSGVEVRSERTIAALREELEARTAAEARLRAELARSRATAGVGSHVPDVGPELAAILSELKLELAGLHEVLERESSAREVAEARVAELEGELHEQGMRSARVYEALAELRGLLEAVRSERRARSPAAAPEHEAATPPETPLAPAAEPVAPTLEADRLDAARTRLRDAVPPRGETVGAPATETEPDRPLKPWLETAFRGLVSHDPPTAGRLLIGLLPAQGLAHPEPIAYDLRLGAEDYVHVTVADEPPLTTVTRASEPRPRDELQFWAEGDPATLARAAAAGGLRRRFGRRRLRISGGRGGFDAVRGIVRLRRSLDELVDCGVRLDPELTFLLVAWTIDPQWTHHERFTIAHAAAEDAAPTYLHVRRGERATVSSAAPLWDVATTIICADDALLGALAGRRGPEIAVRGDDGALATVTSWLDNAQWR